MERILLTGATGCVGSHILEQLAKIDREMSIKLLLRSPDKFDRIRPKLDLQSLSYDVIEGDLDDFDLLRATVKEADTIFHVAAVFDFKSNWERFERINIDATRQIINAMPEDGKFILTASDGVYGFPDKDEPLTEDQPYDPFGNYQKSKMMQEDLARQRCAERGIQFVSIRPTNVVGPRDWMTVPQVIEGIKDRSMVLINGGEHDISVGHPEDVARAHILAYQNIDKVDGEAFHITSVNVPWKQYLDRFSEEIGEEPIKRSIPYFLGYFVGLLGDIWPGDSIYSRFNIKFAGTNRNLDLSKARQHLGYEPQYDLSEIVEESVSWYNSVKEM